MGYGARDLACIALGICVACKERPAGNYRRCLDCRRRKARPWRATPHAARLNSRKLAYTTLKYSGRPPKTKNFKGAI